MPLQLFQNLTLVDAKARKHDAFLKFPLLTIPWIDQSYVVIIDQFFSMGNPMHHLKQEMRNYITLVSDRPLASPHDFHASEPPSQSHAAVAIVHVGVRVAAAAALLLLGAAAAGIGAIPVVHDFVQDDRIAQEMERS